MKARILGWMCGAVLLAAAVSAQDVSDDAEPRREPVRRIKVLQHPYDLASFYRSSSESGRPVYFGGPIVESRESRYPIAGFYRQGGGHGRYSQFWTSGGGSHRGGHRRGYAPRRQRQVGPSELCLLAPTFLAPVAPLAEFER
jgi:hypothetical protein